MLGVADAMVGSYFVLYVTEVAGFGPLETGVFVSIHGIGGILTSWLAGRAFDRRPSRRFAAAAMFSGAAALALMTVVTSFPLLVLIAFTLLGALVAAFPQLFALARVILGDGPAGRRSAPLLRSAWSLAWAVGPLLGTAVLASRGFQAIPRTAAVLIAVAATWLLLMVPAPADRSPQHPGTEPEVRLAPRATFLLTTGVTLFFAAMFAGSMVLPLYVTRDLHLPTTTVGVLFSVCAVVEVLTALALAAIPAGVSQRLIILTGMVCFTLFFAVTILARDVPLLIAGQIARGTGIAVVGAAGIRWFQDAMAPATGRATTLFANATTAGMVLSGVMAGGALALLGYTGTLLLCTALTIAAAAVFAAGSTRSPQKIETNPLRRYE
ncbi:putative sugar efflux transporter [Actinoplanes couchii]|uniref:Sugar efflux transporter n=2 Tax=Actinoplanes couchii TaxID=403638 RepID=A0ABQ3XPD5_9ACTN|nr:putative sugar efflux transporter [Actinoplanes couchii]